ncbi:MAG: PCRF domain-containing protein, partial [Candidatus Eremiobacteraeota bacterium]|nr:PCRF domain-containing protein [Candidatus Eremiobacteraeota bacterium]
DQSGGFDQARFAALARERAQLEETVAAYRAYRRTLTEIAANEALSADRSEPELAALADEELSTLRLRRKELEAQLEELMIPRDPDDVKDLFLEVRAGAGGDEAGIFAGDLLRMYTCFAESRRMRVELISESENEAGGYKEAVVAIKGGEPYRWFKYESGVHRVQRVPVTEASGRIHTSTATVAVIPEADEDAPIEINPKDLQIDTYKSSGAGGQYVNKTESAVRIIHVPTGIIVASQQERSQAQNRDVATNILRAKLVQRAMEERESKLAGLRGERQANEWGSQIRSYVLQPYQLVKDHRTDVETGNAQAVLDGEIDGFIWPYLQRRRAAV